MSSDADQSQRETDGGAIWQAVPQMIAVPMVSFVFMLPIGAILESSGEHPGETPHPFARVGMPFIAVAAGFILGRCTRRFVPAFTRQGQWAWVLSVLLFLLGFMLELRNEPLPFAFLSMLDVEGKEGIRAWLVSTGVLFGRLLASLHSIPDSTQQALAAL